MVGVPGRSQSCITCLSRRKGCDKRRPGCTQCAKSGLTCGGYTRSRVFVNRFQEEDNISSAAYTAGAGSVSRQAGGTSPAEDITLPFSLTQTAYNSRYIDLFWSAYLPGGQLFNDKAASLSHGGWVTVAQDLYPSDRSLQLAMHSVALRGVGTLNDDRSLMKQGSEVYTQCLREFNKALCDPERLRLDGVLCTARLMSLFEMHFGDDGEDDASHGAQSKSWLAHTQGQLAILNAREPREFRSGKSHQLFADYRYILVISAIGNRKRLPLVSKGWRSVPWKSYPKSPQDKLLDILGDLAAILEDIDGMMHCEDNRKRSRARDHIERSCWDLDEQLQTWLAEVGTLKAFQSLENSSDVRGPENSEDFALAHLTILYWATCVLLYTNLSAFVDRKEDLPERADPTQYAGELVAALPFFFTQGAGIMGQKMAAFPLGIVLQVLFATENAPSEHREALVRLLQEQDGNGGIGKFLKNLQRGAAGPGQRESCESRGVEMRARKWMNLAGSRTGEITA